MSEPKQALVDNTPVITVNRSIGVSNWLLQPSPFGKDAPPLIENGYKPIPTMGKIPAHWTGTFDDRDLENSYLVGLFERTFGRRPVYGDHKFRPLKNWKAITPEDYAKGGCLEHAYGAWERLPITGVGVLLTSTFLAIDIDTESAIVLNTVDDYIQSLGGTVVAKRGKRGRTYFVRTDGNIDANKIQTTVGGIDLLGEGRQTVLPPSMHPSGMQYVWTTSDRLTDTHISKLPFFDAEALDRLLEALRAAGVDPHLAGNSGRTGGDWADYHDPVVQYFLDRRDMWVSDLPLVRLNRSTGGVYRCVPVWRPSTGGRPTEERKASLVITATGIVDWPTSAQLDPWQLVELATGWSSDEAWRWLVDKTDFLVWLPPLPEIKTTSGRWAGADHLNSDGVEPEVDLLKTEDTLQNDLRPLQDDEGLRRNSANIERQVRRFREYAGAGGEFEKQQKKIRLAKNTYIATVREVDSLRKDWKDLDDRLRALGKEVQDDIMAAQPVDGGEDDGEAYNREQQAEAILEVEKRQIRRQRNEILEKVASLNRKAKRLEGEIKDHYFKLLIYILNPQPGTGKTRAIGKILLADKASHYIVASLSNVLSHQLVENNKKALLNNTAMLIGFDQKHPKTKRIMCDNAEAGRKLVEFGGRWQTAHEACGEDCQMHGILAGMKAAQHVAVNHGHLQHPVDKTIGSDIDVGMWGGFAHGLVIDESISSLMLGEPVARPLLTIGRWSGDDQTAKLRPLFRKIIADMIDHHRATPLRKGKGESPRVMGRLGLGASAFPNVDVEEVEKAIWAVKGAIKGRKSLTADDVAKMALKPIEHLDFQMDFLEEIKAGMTRRPAGSRSGRLSIGLHGGDKKTLQVIIWPKVKIHTDYLNVGAVLYANAYVEDEETLREIFTRYRKITIMDEVDEIDYALAMDAYKSDLKKWQKAGEPEGEEPQRPERPLHKELNFKVEPVFIHMDECEPVKRSGAVSVIRYDGAPSGAGQLGSGMVKAGEDPLDPSRGRRNRQEVFRLVRDTCKREGTKVVFVSSEFLRSSMAQWFESAGGWPKNLEVLERGKSAGLNKYENHTDIIIVGAHVPPADQLHLEMCMRVEMWLYQPEGKDLEIKHEAFKDRQRAGVLQSMERLRTLRFKGFDQRVHLLLPSSLDLGIEYDAQPPWDSIVEAQKAAYRLDDQMEALRHGITSNFTNMDIWQKGRFESAGELERFMKGDWPEHVVIEYRFRAIGGQWSKVHTLPECVDAVTASLKRKLDVEIKGEEKHPCTTPDMDKATDETAIGKNSIDIALLSGTTQDMERAKPLSRNGLILWEGLSDHAALKRLSEPLEAGWVRVMATLLDNEGNATKSPAQPFAVLGGATEEQIRVGIERLTGLRVNKIRNDQKN